MSTPHNYRQGPPDDGLCDSCRNDGRARCYPLCPSLMLRKHSDVEAAERELGNEIVDWLKMQPVNLLDHKPMCGCETCRRDIPRDGIGELHT